MMSFPTQCPDCPELEPVFQALAEATSHHRWEPPASEAQIAAAERTLGRPLPPDLRAIYRLSDGLYLLGGNLNFYPLQAKKDKGWPFGLISVSKELREYGWPICDEIVIFANNGGEESFGLWLPRHAGGLLSAPVNEIGEVFDRESFAVAGTSLRNFLVSWCAYYLMLCDAPPAALDLLGVPKKLRKLDDDELFVALRTWADPHTPDPDPDPYERGHTADELRAMYGASA